MRKYRFGQCTKRELEIIDRWYQSLDKDQSDLSEMDDLTMTGKQMLENINNRIDQKEEKKRLQEKEKAIRKLDIFNFPNLKKVAAVFFLVGTGLVLLHYIQNIPKGLEKGNAAYVENSPSTIYLSDGSVVWLKEGSRLDYPSDFRGSTREVTLIGEAFFDIAKDQDKPFIILTANFTTSVLGTSFNIKAYENDVAQEVAVVTGKVLVSVKEDTDIVKEVILEPNEKAIIQKEKSLIELVEVENSDHGALVKSKLVFMETSLEDIIKVLSRAHDVNISLVNENMKNCVITADLTDETLEISLEILSKAIHAEYSMSGNKILLSGQGCRSQ